MGDPPITVNSEGRHTGLALRLFAIFCLLLFIHYMPSALRSTLCSLLLLARIFYGHFIEETFLLQLLEKTKIDELLRLGILCLRHLRRQCVEEKLKAFKRWIRF